MYAFNMTGGPEPQRFMDPFVSWEIASKANKWAGRNNTRWRNEEYDRAWKAAEPRWTRSSARRCSSG